jgi:four helix bundle protein
MDSRPTLRERAFQFGLAVFRMVPAVRRHGLEYVSVADQLARSATAVGALLEEGAVAASRKDMAHKHTLALREARESAYWLRLLRSSGFTIAGFDDVEREAGELCAMLTVSVRKLRDAKA